MILPWSIDAARAGPDGASTVHSLTMCGIAGLLDPRQETPYEELGRIAIGMASSLVHRGPDDSGVWIDPEGRAALGHRRLSIVALGPEGHQPMVSSAGRWVLSYNGEIYNFRALRRRLRNEGVPFRGACDTEVLLEAVQHWGIDKALDAVEGMFALAAWDRSRAELHLARDRFGEKPLYYGWVDDRMAYASELKSFVCLPGFDAELDRDALAVYLKRNCIPAPMTVYRGLAKLLPGQIATFDGTAAAGAEPAFRRFWSARAAVDEARRHPAEGSERDLVDELEETLRRSVASRMVADVPIGAFLSGGVDSSLVVALMQECCQRPVRTFTVGFTDRAFDESEEAAAVARHLGTDHVRLDVTDDDAAGVIPELPEIWDEPFGDISQIPELLVSRLARTAVSVSLSGDGGDELFAGYNRHAWLERVWNRSQVLPARVRRGAGAALGSLPPGMIEGSARAANLLPMRWRLRNPATKVAKVARVLAAPTPEAAYESLLSHWEESGIVHGAAPNWVLSNASAAPDLAGITEQMLWFDTTRYLPDDILTKLDRAGMAVSLETRAPFLDREVFSLAWRLPMSLKIREGMTKWILRQVLYRRVPAKLIERPKMGFGVPIGAWLRGSLRAWGEELLSEQRLREQELLDPGPIRLAWRLHMSGKRDLGYELWDVLALQSWLDRWAPGRAC